MISQSFTTRVDELLTVYSKEGCST
ncbi:hypothetical protein LU679_21845 [Pseudomonas putida]|nr:hypothetical protein [Pseudomonas putida]MCE0967033.1 hypothetical protein [Pseudomonas sp. NMI4491_12]MDN5520393.1 hypothetical protein [Pseudomonas sp.]